MPAGVEGEAKTQTIRRPPTIPPQLSRDGHLTLPLSRAPALWCPVAQGRACQFESIRAARSLSCPHPNPTEALTQNTTRTRASLGPLAATRGVLEATRGELGATRGDLSFGFGFSDVILEESEPSTANPSERGSCQYTIESPEPRASFVPQLGYVSEAGAMTCTEV